MGLDDLFSIISGEEISRSGSFEVSMSTMTRIEAAMPTIFRFGSAGIRKRFLVPDTHGKKIGAISLIGIRHSSPTAPLPTSPSYCHEHQRGEAPGECLYS